MADVIPVVIENYFLLFLDPGFLPVMALVVALVALQYRRSESVRESMFGMKGGGIWRDTLSATVFGLAGGLVGSFLMVFIGLPLTGTGSVFILLLLIAGVLMLFSPRFLCLAYAGGVVSLISIFSDLISVNIYQLLALVALLHMVESLLIFFSGHLGAVPAFFKGRSGRIVGGFTLQKFWPIPLVALTVFSLSPEVLNLSGMPHWWPLIKPGGSYDPNYYEYTLVSVVAGLGYGDLAIAHNPREKSKISALYLAVYSLTLLALAVSAQYVRVLAPLAALFSPLGHELVIYFGKRTELAGKPLYTVSGKGIRVLDVLVDSTAWHMGIRSGDILAAVNGIPVRERWDLKNALESAVGAVEIEYLKEGRIYRRGVAHRGDSTRPLGILTILEGNEYGYLEINTPGYLYRKISAWRERFKR